MSKELEDRFQNYAKAVRDYCTRLKWDVINKEYIRQLIRSNGSISANYIEASDDLGPADERMKIKLSRREAKETIMWLDLVLSYNDKKNTFSNTHKTEQIGHPLSLVSCALCHLKLLSAILIKLSK